MTLMLLVFEALAPQELFGNCLVLEVYLRVFELLFEVLAGLLELHSLCDFFLVFIRNLLVLPCQLLQLLE